MTPAFIQMQRSSRILKQTTRFFGETGFLFFVAFMVMPSSATVLFTDKYEQGACQAAAYAERYPLHFEIITNPIGASVVRNLSPITIAVKGD